ncbi:response regulator transcription factor [Intestinimonas butyriciproducens]|uniref:response regulator transcription factor n=1 Tax=Intestinimonas butyriciproducens TaxID=1297617 RepID=UPI0019595D9F|nr:response regulator transcription factor [Intestinimonas butyriciproducens]MBM6974976.1 response regulator transcription factor [Intestinimonas butyriciproducens]
MKDVKKEKTKIMVVDDDDEIREVIAILLSNENYDVIEAKSGEDALKLLTASIDLIILDVMMPGMSGYQTSREIRKLSNMPILFLTARTQSSDLLMGYSSGGDDYLAKPFSYSELIARVKGLLRRYMVYQGKMVPERKAEYIEWGDLRLDICRNMAWKLGKELNLTQTEYRILRLFLSHPGQIFSAQNIYESVWEEPFYSTDSNSVMVFIRRLRNKIEDDPRQPTHLVTVWGKGYRFE